MITPFPNIPTFANGVLGATHLNALKNGLDYLLGISHGPFCASYCADYRTDESEIRCDTTTYWDTHYYYGYIYPGDLGKARLFYSFWAKSEETYYIRLQVYNDGSTWQDVFEISAANASWTRHEGTVSLASLSLTAGYIYRFRIQIKSSQNGKTSWFQIWYLAIQQSYDSLATNPTFTNGATSGATAFNTLRSNLLALKARLPTALALTPMPVKTSYADTSTHIYFSAAYRYRPDTLYCKVRSRTSWTEWNWTIQFYSAPETSVALYTRSNISPTYDTPTWYSQEIDLTSEPYASLLSGAGISLTTGTVYKVRYYFRKPSSAGSVVQLQGAGLYRKNTAKTPGGSWTVIAPFSEGDTNVGATKLNKFGTDIAELDTGGSEELWTDLPLNIDATVTTSNYQTSSDENFGFSGIFAKRWLVYMVSDIEEPAPAIHYGANLEKRETLSTDEGWQSFDLRSTDIPVGTFLAVQNVRHAFLSDTPVEGKP